MFERPLLVLNKWSPMSKPKPAPWHPRPETIDDYRRYAIGVYAANNWDLDEQLRHRRSLGIADAPVEQLPFDDLKTVINDFEDAKMILFRVNGQVFPRSTPKTARGRNSSKE